MKIKTSELSGVALDWAVAKSVGKNLEISNGRIGNFVDNWLPNANSDFVAWAPSIKWSQGGTLIDQFDVYFDRYPLDQSGFVVARIGMDYQAGSNYFNNPSSPNRLIAACRAIVSAKLGDEVDVPEELL